MPAGVDPLLAIGTLDSVRGLERVISQLTLEELQGFIRLESSGQRRKTVLARLKRQARKLAAKPFAD